MKTYILDFNAHLVSVSCNDLYLAIKSVIKEYYPDYLLGDIEHLDNIYNIYTDKGYIVIYVKEIEASFSF